jgi:ferric-dicitrate binding protein FerR (iron transport regulator)
MLHAIVTSTALLIAAQAGARAVIAAEAKRWLGPTRVRLDFSDRTLAEIVDGLNAQAPAMLAIRPESRRFPRDSETAPPPPRR